MKQAPGSFSKNFAWHGTGLRRLHDAVKKGFDSQLQPVGRQTWRDRSGINDKNLDLVPINFFLHNRAGNLSVDELVFQAIRRPHSVEFDRLALFAFHLNRVGDGPRVVERPAMWANAFLQDRLWQEGAWIASALDDESLDGFIEDHMDAQEEVRIKCRNNYRHLFELCGYRPSPLPIINSAAHAWLPSAYFLAWDRYILDGGNAARPELLRALESENIHTLIGTTQEYALGQAEPLVDTYLDAGNTGRFSLPESERSSLTPLSTLLHSPAQTELVEEETNVWIEQEETDAVVQRRNAQLQTQVRNRKKAAALKRHYDNTCLFCGIKLQTSRNIHYSEAAHVKALGKPHNGPDRATNMIVLCPNHHLQFDRGVLRLRKTSNGFVIKSRVQGDILDGKRIDLRHPLDEEMVRYHWAWHSSNWR